MVIIVFHLSLKGCTGSSGSQAGHLWLLQTRTYIGQDYLPIVCVFSKICSSKSNCVLYYFDKGTTDPKLPPVL